MVNSVSNKKIIIGLGILVAVVILGALAISTAQLKQSFSSKGLVGVGKTLEVDITKSSDYTMVLDDEDILGLWNKSERQKMADYMKKNNYKIKPGKYKLNQGTSFDKALSIFQFE